MSSVHGGETVRLQESVAKDKEEHAWTARDFMLAVGGVCGICGMVGGTYYYSSLFAALEEDPSLGWLPSDTTKLAMSATALNTMGHLIAGPLGDALAPMKLLAFEALMVCLGVANMSLNNGKISIFLIVCSITFFKGLMWPAISAALSANQTPSKHDVTFLVYAMGSRMADIMTATTLSVAMTKFGMEWRTAILVLLGLIVTLFVLAAFALPRDIRLPSTSLRAERSIGFAEKWSNLIRSPDCWLVFCINFSIYAVWALYDYLGVIIHDMYGISAGEAAGEPAYISFGALAGLLVGMLASSALGPRRGRQVHTLQSCMAVVSLFTLGVVKVSLPVLNFLLAVTGFGFVVNSYLPLLLLAARSSPSERAFRNGTIDGLCSGTSLLFSFTYGLLREHHNITMIWEVATFWMFVSAVASTYFQYRMQAAEDSLAAQAVKSSDQDADPVISSA